MVQEEKLLAAGKAKQRKMKDERVGGVRAIEPGCVSRAVSRLMPKGGPNGYKRQMFDQYAMPGARTSVQQGRNPTRAEFFDSLVQLGSITEEERAAQERQLGSDVPGVIRTWPTMEELALMDQQQAGTVTIPRKKKKKKKEHRCAVCGKAASDLAEGEKLRKCSKCELCHYCGAECQRADWKEHKKVCGQCD
jgi:hypothetical protein